MGEGIGKAYGFFDCDASRKAINEELPIIRRVVKTPAELERYLFEGVDNVKGNPGLLEAIREEEIYPIFPERLKALMNQAKPVRITDLKYALEATYPGATNEKTADEVADILTKTYQRFEEGNVFTGAIIFEKDGEYVFRE